jgi:predicted O-methyltransferase YrrM
MQSEDNFTKEYNPLLPDTSRWSSRDEQGAEAEVSEFIYGLVRLLKPQFVVETGCYLGDTTLAISNALRENEYGELFSCDIDPDKVEETMELLSENDRSAEKDRRPTAILTIPGKDLIKQLSRIDFAFIDSGNAKTRKEEIDLVIPKMPKYGIIVLHDTAPQHIEMNKTAEEISLSKIYFNTPRGLTIYQK